SSTARTLSPHPSSMAPAPRNPLAHSAHPERPAHLDRPARFRATSESNRPRRLRDILDRSQFEAVLRHERSRSDRDENDFSLVLIKVRAGEARSARRVARSVLRRLRDTDEVGWYAAGCLCILLPNTASHGGRVFESGVRRLAETGGIQFVSRVYTYP